MSKESTKDKLYEKFGLPIEKIKLEQIGEVNLSPLSAMGMINLGKKLKKNARDCSADEYIDGLLSLIIYRGKREEKEFLSDEELSKITKSDKELIIKKLLEMSPGLYKENLSNKSTNEKGEIVIKLSHGEVKYPQEEGESLFEYYHRLSIVQEKELEEQAKKMTDRLKSSLNFSSGLNNRIADMFKNMNPIASQMSHIQKMAEISQPFADLHKSMSTASKFRDITKNIGVSDAVKSLPKFDNRLERDEFKLVLPKDHKLEALNELKESSDLMTTKMDDFIQITTLMLNELKDSGDHAKESSEHSKTSSRTNLRLTKIVIFITVLFGFSSLIATFLASNSSTDAMLPSLKKIVSSIETQDSSNGENSKKIIELLRKNLESNQEILKELKKSNSKIEVKKIKK